MNHEARDRSVLIDTLNGRRGRHIAQAYGISPTVVYETVRQWRERLGVHKSIALLGAALDKGLIRREPGRWVLTGAHP